LNKLYVLAPALVPLAYMIIMLIVFLARRAVGRPVEVQNRRKFSLVFGPVLTDYLVWLLQPIERLFVVRRVSPNTLTIASLLACAISAVAIATSHLATAGWAYIFAGMFDLLDGRLARATKQESKAGAFLDSVSDRWGELFVFSGFAWMLHDSYWLLAVMLAMAGSMMVSYTRARGESLGVSLDGGFMQRAERIAVVSMGILVTAWFDAGSDTAEYVPHVIGVALTLTGLGASITAVTRWVRGYRQLKALEARRSAEDGDMRISGERPAASR
jgi:CDP-diacylglycerol---glycerol-3-phosphate 3-phosphatidyltransferase